MCGNGFREETVEKGMQGGRWGVEKKKKKVTSAAAKKTLSVFCILGCVWQPVPDDLAPECYLFMFFQNPDMVGLHREEEQRVR